MADTNTVLPLWQHWRQQWKPPEQRPQVTRETLFQRVRGAYDLDRMALSRVIYIGAGGAASFIEDMGRAGVVEHILIDPDTVADSNLATQQTYCRDIGKPKVICIQERLYAINPDVRVCSYQNTLDEIGDKEFFELAFAPFVSPVHGGETPFPAVTLLCGLTDTFYAQARVNRLALQFGIPSLCAQLYHEGRAAEITFTYPGMTPACHRCMLNPRYKAYLENGYQNTVTSDGAPIFVTTRLNALKGQIAMALLHHGTNHPRWGRMLQRIGNRTLVQLRLHPDGPLQVFDRVFAGADTARLFFDEPVWLPQEPDPNCPECRGTGDLRAAKDTFADTRIMLMPHIA